MEAENLIVACGANCRPCSNTFNHISGSSFACPAIGGYMANIISFIRHRIHLQNPTACLVYAVALCSTDQESIIDKSFRISVGHGTVDFSLIANQPFAYAENINCSGPAMETFVDCKPNSTLRVGMSYLVPHIRPGHNPLPYSFYFAIVLNGKVAFSNSIEADHTTAFHAASIEVKDGGKARILLFSTNNGSDNPYLAIAAFGAENKELVFTRAEKCIKRCIHGHCKDGICVCDEKHSGADCRTRIGEPKESEWVDGTSLKFFVTRKKRTVIHEVDPVYANRSVAFGSCTNHQSVASFEFEWMTDNSNKIEINNKCKGQLYIALFNPSSIPLRYKIESHTHYAGAQMKPSIEYDL